MKKIIMNINELYCNRCPTLIERKLNKIDGISRVICNYKSNNCQIRYNKSEISINSIKKIIFDLGFVIN